MLTNKALNKSTKQKILLQMIKAYKNNKKMINS